MGVQSFRQHVAGVVQHIHIAQRACEIDGELFSVRRRAQQQNDVDVRVAIEQILAETFKSGRGFWIDGESLAPLLLGFLPLACLIQNECQHLVWLDDLGIEFDGLLQFRKRVYDFGCHRLGRGQRDNGAVPTCGSPFMAA